MNRFPSRLLFLLACLSFAVAHDVCEYQRISLGITKTSAECQTKCIQFDADDVESTRKCIAWGHNYKNEKCSGWVLEEEPDDDYYNFYGVGSYYDYSYVDFDTCNLALNTNITVAHTRRAHKLGGCFFELKNLGYAKTPEECQGLCVELISKRHGGCLAWSHSEDEEECEGLLSMPTDKFTSCGRA